MRKDEQKIAWAIAEYLTLKHPDIIYRFDVAAGLKMTIGQATVIKKKLLHKEGYPDLFIAEPRGKWHGLYLELKKDRNEVYKKDGGRRKNKHVQVQRAMLDRLLKKGYAATFCFGVDDCINVIEGYLQGYSVYANILEAKIKGGKS